MTSPARSTPRTTILVAYAAGTLHLEKAGTYHLLLGADDGVSVTIDGKHVFLRDEARPQRDGDDLITVDLAAGDHPIVLKLHQRDAAWAFSVRVLDASYAPPEGAYLSLPGTTEADAKDLAWKMSWVSVDRGMVGTGYAPKLTVRFPEGMPRGVPVKVHARLAPSHRPVERRHGEDAPPQSSKAGASPPPHPPNGGAALPPAPPPPPAGDPVFDVDAGEVPIDAQGAGELVVSLPQLHGAALAKVEDKDWAFEVNVGGRVLKPGFYPRRAAREAVGHAERAIAGLGASEAPSWLVAGLLDSVTHVKEHLVKLVGKGDYDTEALDAEAAELEALASSLEKKQDPYASRSGPMRRAYRSGTDGELSEFGLYVPHKHLTETDRKFPLVVGLHGMNGNGMSMLRWVFGYDDRLHDSDWENRHMPADLPTLDAFVVTPDAYGNTMYRDFGEDDVMRVVDVGDDDLSHRPRARLHHRPVDGRHRRGVHPLPLSRQLPGDRAALRLPQLRGAGRLQQSPGAPVGEAHRRGALQHLVGLQRPSGCRCGSSTARRTCPRRTARCSSMR